MEAKNLVFGLDIGTRSIVGTVGYKENTDDFVVIAQEIRFHKTRAMLDGQIHDINKVSDLIREVKEALEKKICGKLENVCIAAAGRVLRTVNAHSEMEYPREVEIDSYQISALELQGVENAYEVMKEDVCGRKEHFYCVAYTVSKYYLNDTPISNLLGHKTTKIAADLLATFLPDEVIKGLYSAVEKAGLKVVNLTLEPIAAIHVAIPEKFRLLNLAMVDIGAGTSDISVTRDGSVAAFGMIPMAGDAITEVIAKHYLVDFNTAEEMKLAASSGKKVVTYTDVFGDKKKLNPQEVLSITEETQDELAKRIAECITGLNGDKKVSAAFIVGGGGKMPGFSSKLANHLEILNERVALRGKEVLEPIKFLNEAGKKDSSFVTPIGICLNYYENSNSFIFIRINDENMKLFDNGKLTIVDASTQYGFAKEKLFAKRGKGLSVTVNGEVETFRGEYGEPARILKNGEEVSIDTPVHDGDVISITESTQGADAKIYVKNIRGFKESIFVTLDKASILLPVQISVNGVTVDKEEQLHDNDVVIIKSQRTVKELREMFEISEDIVIAHDGVVMNGDELLADGMNLSTVRKNYSEELKKEETTIVESTDDEFNYEGIKYEEEI